MQQLHPQIHRNVVGHRGFVLPRAVAEIGTGGSVVQHLFTGEVAQSHYDGALDLTNVCNAVCYTSYTNTQVRMLLLISMGIQ